MKFLVTKLNILRKITIRVYILQNFFGCSYEFSWSDVPLILKDTVFISLKTSNIAPSPANNLKLMQNTINFKE